MIAIEEKNIEYAERLLSSGANVNEKNKAGQSALILAARSGLLDLVKLLLENGADIEITNKVKHLRHHFSWNRPIVAWPNPTFCCLLLQS
mgnify:CR=1 FL=1